MATLVLPTPSSAQILSAPNTNYRNTMLSVRNVHFLRLINKLFFVRPPGLAAKIEMLATNEEIVEMYCDKFSNEIS